MVTNESFRALREGNSHRIADFDETPNLFPKESRGQPKDTAMEESKVDDEFLDKNDQTSDKAKAIDSLFLDYYDHDTFGLKDYDLKFKILTRWQNNLKDKELKSFSEKANEKAELKEKIFDCLAESKEFPILQENLYLQRSFLLLPERKQKILANQKFLVKGLPDHNVDSFIQPYSCIAFNFGFFINFFYPSIARVSSKSNQFVGVSSNFSSIYWISAKCFDVTAYLYQSERIDFRKLKTYEQSSLSSEELIFANKIHVDKINKPVTTSIYFEPKSLSSKVEGTNFVLFIFYQVIFAELPNLDTLVTSRVCFPLKNVFIRFKYFCRKEQDTPLKGKEITEGMDFNNFQEDASRGHLLVRIKD